MSETRSLSLRDKLGLLIYQMRSQASDIAALSAETNNNAQVAAKSILRWADELDALRAQEPSCDHVYERQVCEQCAKCGDLRGCIQPAQEPPQIECPLCGVVVKQVSSATLDLALWQHVNWTHCRSQEPPQAQIEEVCLGCGKPTATSDCGCPAGTGMRRRAKHEAVTPSARALEERAYCGHERICSGAVEGVLQWLPAELVPDHFTAQCAECRDRLADLQWAASLAGDTPVSAERST
jgi:hypothetical protein